ncbi:MAG: hypothetical protein RJA49_1779 [Actinomycetota bacterium]
MEAESLEWIPEGRAFGAEDMVWFAGREDRPLDDVLAGIDLVVTGPHASAAFPAEMARFVAPSLTKRLQFDFTDVSTSPVARRWAEIDDRVLYIENPHPRAVRDANRPRPVDVLDDVRAAFRRLTAAGSEGRPSLTGVDAVRPVTFGYLPVLCEPTDDSEWQRLGDALRTAGALGIDRYERLRDELVQRVIEAKLRRLADIDPSAVASKDWASAVHLDVLSIHDTMNHTARPDGAICLEREPKDRLPNVVALSNRGDATGDVIPRDSAALRAQIDVPTMPPARIRIIGNAYATAFAAPGADDVAYNRPYLGGHETQTMGPMLRDLEPLAVVRRPGQEPRRLQLGAWQNEFLREFLLGPESTAALMEPGGGWVAPPPDRVEWLAERLRTAHDLVRAAGE